MWVQPRYYKAVGTVLAAARESAGLSQQDVARRLAKPQSFISAYESGGRRVDLLEFHLIVDALGGNPLEVFKTVSAAVRRSKR